VRPHDGARPLVGGQLDGASGEPVIGERAERDAPGRVWVDVDAPVGVRVDLGEERLGFLLGAQRLRQLLAGRVAS